jgi:small subunit ribosomal protein S6
VTRRYEVVYLFESALEEPAINEHLSRFHALLGPGVNVTVAHWGKRALSYKIRRHETAYYAVAQFEADPTVLPEFERAIKLDESVIRFLVAVMEADLPPAPVPVAAAAGAVLEDEE